MTCQFLNGDRCQLAELHAGTLQPGIRCSTSEAVCAACLSRGFPLAEKPSLPCVGLVTGQIEKQHLPAWRKYVGRLLYGPRKGCDEADLQEPVEREPRVVAQPCVHRGPILETFNCGCTGGGKQHVYECDVAGRCCQRAEHVERAVEHLRRGGYAKDDRKVRACEGCKDAVPLIQLSSQ